MSDKIRKHDDADGGREGGLSVVTDVRSKAKPPSLYRVILINDDYTPMEFVIEVLERFFNKDHADATRIMLNVHNQGRGICGCVSKRHRRNQKRPC